MYALDQTRGKQAEPKKTIVIKTLMEQQRLERQLLKNIGGTSSGPPAELSLSLLMTRLTCCSVNKMLDILSEVLL